MTNPIGIVRVGRTAYTVEVVRRGPKSRELLPDQRTYQLVGPNGATYYVIDHGPGYRVGSMAMGGSKAHHWTPSPRGLRGLTREHIAPFYDHPDHTMTEETAP